ncbi:MAG: 2-C-methyl-D-erythritol 2,4-cyclodiphosphate synthase [Muribaculaceae bacterium]|nr:2-C-methyl-D-erythritol 2,4-cyclodiphosphate synthase [Muribaculaceae bacterium]MDE6866353.1 2-C-methyl-D-erythritol 2,4-cyclodiphosphate synthase [Muribaculaceae bacterium]
MIRIGQGYDVHRLVEGRELWLCGEKIEFELGLLGHSDADVAIHALCDAMLGALALGDIGKHFPDSDPAYKGIDSKKLLREVCLLIDEKGYRLGNADITICAERPKLRPHIDTMRQRLAEVINTPVDNISVKATTTERLGFTGRMEGISAYAVVLLLRK